MKNLNISFEDEDFEKLRKSKERSGCKSWEKFILDLLIKNQRLIDN